MPYVDLNCDLGESFGRYTLGLDDQVIPLITSANIACGMHAGDPLVMRRTVEMATRAGIAIGAHPGYPDLQGFGRRDMRLSPDEAYAFVSYQIGALAAFCKQQGTRLHHVKPHGQMYNRAALDKDFAQAIAQAVYDFDPSLILVGLGNGKLIDAGKETGLRTAGEFFTDRNYTDEGTLVPRTQDKAMITDESFAVKRAIRAVTQGNIESVSGKTIPVCADTICVHGDGTKALEFVKTIKAALQEAGVELKAL